jgi:ectoine hydroxylase-related dioxygenase (phytanoyl-CoA dioxygenase family)
MAAMLKKGMTPAQKYYFDTAGYLILRGALSPSEVDAANAAIDHHSSHFHERKDELRCNTHYGRRSTALDGDGSTGRFDMAGMLAWEKPYCDPFRDLLVHPSTRPILNDILGSGYRLDHSPLVIEMHKGSNGHTLHGGRVDSSGRPSWDICYDCRNGEIRTQLVNVTVALTDVKKGDGGFCVVPGSHKSHFPPPDELRHYEDFTELVEQPAVKKGDILIFTEAALHGTLPWCSDQHRRSLLIRFSPAMVAYGRGYIPHWPAENLEGMTPAQLAVMEPPYNLRMNRPSLSSEGGEEEVVQPQPREAFKIEFDEKVFGSKYY